MSLVSKAFDIKLQASKEAFNRIRTSGGQEIDKDLETYAKMTPEAIAKMVDVYGIDKVIHYVKTMESKRMTKKGA